MHKNLRCILSMFVNFYIFSYHREKNWMFRFRFVFFACVVALGTYFNCLRSPETANFLCAQRLDDHSPKLEEPEWYRESVSSLDISLGDRVGANERNWLSANAPNVKSIRVAGADDTFLQLCRHFVVLEELNLWHRSIISDTGLQSLGDLQFLRVLSLPGSRIRGHGLSKLRKVNKIEQLDLSETNLDDDGLESVGALTSLVHLNLSGSNVTDVGMTSLRRLNQLESLDLRKTKISADGLKHLVDLPRLEIVNVPDTISGDEIVAALNGAVSLESFNISRGFSDWGLERLTAFDRVTKVALVGPGFTHSGLAKLSELPFFTELSLSDVTITSEMANSICNLRALKVLELNNVKIDISNSSYVWLSNIKDLYSLRVTDSLDSDEIVRAVQMCRRLRRLDLLNMKIDVSCLDRIASLDQLQTLYVTGSGLDDRAAVPISRMGNLRILGIGDTAITEAGIRLIGKMARLRIVEIPSASSKALLLELQHELPGIRFFRYESGVH